MARTSEPELTVLLPLTDLRGPSAAPHVRTWTHAQTLPRERFQVIAVSDGDSEVEREVEPLLTDQDLLLRGSPGQFEELYNLAAQRASAPWLIVTEGHVLAAPDCLEQVSAAIAGDPELAAARLLYTHVVETSQDALCARWLDTQFELWANADEWIRLAFAGALVRRDAWERFGGLDPRYGFFSISALSAQLHAARAKVTVLTDARIGHVPEPVREHHAATANFTAGECAARAELDPGFCERWFGFDPIWHNRHLSGRRARRLAVVLTLAAARAARESPRDVPWLAAELGRALGRVTPRAAELRDQAAISASELAVERLERLAGVRWEIYRRAQDRVIRLVRSRAARAAGPEPHPTAGRWTAGTLSGAVLAGTHGLEHANGHAFRWTEPAAQLKAPPSGAAHVLEIDTGGLRGDPRGWLHGVYAGTRRLPDSSISARDGTLQVTIPAYLAGEHVTLLARPLMPARQGSPDARRLGLPVVALELRAA